MIDALIDIEETFPKTVTQYIGDCRSVLKTLEANSVHCCVTSPPYYGLRDYGTATWEGGDPSCDHKKVVDPSISVATSTLGGGKKTVGHSQEGSAGWCHRCGAVRVDSQIGLEQSPEAYVAEMVAVFREVRRVLHDTGTLWLNLGDSYNNRTKVRTTSHQPALNDFVDDNWVERAARGGVRMTTNQGDLKEKDLMMIPARVALALQSDGWYLRSDIIWVKPSPMPESVRDRPTSSYEHIFLFSKNERYYYDGDAIAEPVTNSTIARMTQDVESQVGSTRAHGGTRDGRPMGAVGGLQTRNARNVWTITPNFFRGAHFATFPIELASRCIKAGSKAGDLTLDPFSGAGTTAVAALKLGRRAVLIELNPDYAALARTRIAETMY